jgi:hypothetical protein
MIPKGMATFLKTSFSQFVLGMWSLDHNPDYVFKSTYNLIGEFDQLDPYVERAGFAPALEVTGGHTIPFGNWQTMPFLNATSEAGAKPARATYGSN